LEIDCTSTLFLTFCFRTVALQHGTGVNMEWLTYTLFHAFRHF